MLSGLFCGLCGPFHIAGVIAGIKNAEHADSILSSLFNELVNHIVGIVAVSQKILCTEKHHNLAVGKSSMELSKALPRILIQKTDAGVIGCSTPSLDGPVADFVNHTTSRKHIGSGHTGCMQ